MCGIFAYIGKRSDAAQIVLDGLKTLEYRGYDSWGIAVKKDRILEYEKHVGKIGNASTTLPDSNLGIGHTRWATHGGVTDSNSHPHMDCDFRIALVHNGIVENNEKIRADLLKKGHTFKSETDTEVIVHLIEENLKSDSFEIAAKKAFNSLKGLNAIVAIDTQENSVVAAKNGSPLIVGKGKDEYIIASDASAVIPHTRELLFVEDNSMVVVNGTIKLISLATDEEIEPEFQTVDWKIEEAEMGEYPHFMIKEIHEQPKVIRNIANNYEGDLRKMVDIFNNSKGIFFVGVGTAFNACLAGSYFFSKIAKSHVNAVLGSEFNYLEDFINKDSLIVAFSQSGETIDVIEPLQKAKAKGAKIAALVNVLGSTIYRTADFKILLGAGPEKAVASTKAYIAKASMIMMLAYTLSGDFERGKQLLLKAADEVEKLLSNENIENFKKIAKHLATSEHIYTIGRGSSFPIALESALKIKEVSYVHTEGLAGGELKHGPIALIDKGTPVIVFAPNDETYESIISNATEIKSRGGLIIGIGTEKADIYDYFIKVEDLEEASTIAQAVPAQLISYYMTIEKNFDPDKPRNLAKSVTVK